MLGLKDLVLLLEPRFMEGLGPDIPASIDPDGKPDTPFQKSLNEDPVVESAIEEPHAITVQKIRELGDKVDDGFVHADKGRRAMGENQGEEKIRVPQGLKTFG